MSFSPEQTASLNGKLDPKNVKKPSGSFGPKGDYIEGWHAIAEANRIFGFDGWSYRIVDIRQCHEPYQNDKQNFSVGYVARVEVMAGGVSREDIGYGSGHAKGIGDAHESAVKEAVTDALKRGLKSFGNPFGLALYDKTQANVGVTVDTAGNAVIADTMIEAINLAETRPDLEKWTNGQRARMRELDEVNRKRVTGAITKRHNELPAVNTMEAG